MLFSVIIPIFRVEKYIRASIDSVLVQSTEDFELILVDDGSDDGCPKICDEYAAKDDRIRVIHKQNGGLVSARNAGIKAAEGEYICYVDGDDTVSPDWLFTIKEKIEASPTSPDMVVFGAQRIFKDHIKVAVINTSDGFYDKERLQKEIYPRLISDRQQEYGDAIILPAPWNRVYKASLLREHYCRDEGIQLGEDTAFVFECCLCAENMAVCSDILYFYNKMNDGSITNKADPERLKKRLRLFEYISVRLKEFEAAIGFQMDDFYASRIIYDIYHMIHNGQGISEAARNLSRNLKETQILDYVHVRNIPFKAKVFFMLLKAHLYRTLLLLIKMRIR